MGQESDTVVVVLLRGLRDQLDGLDGRFTQLHARLDQSDTADEATRRQFSDHQNAAFVFHRRTEDRLEDLERRVRILETMPRQPDPTDARSTP